MPHSAQDIDLPDDVHPELKQVIDDHKLLFARRLEKTMTAEHFIDTGNFTPVKVPPRPMVCDFPSVSRNSDGVTENSPV